MPWTARKLLWNPEPMGKEFGRICLEAFDTNPNDFGRTVMNLLERDYGISSLNLSKGRHEASRFFGNLIKVWWDEVFFLPSFNKSWRLSCISLKSDK